MDIQVDLWQVWGPTLTGQPASQVAVTTAVTPVTPKVTSSPSLGLASVAGIIAVGALRRGGNRNGAVRRMVAVETAAVDEKRLPG